MDLPPCGLAPSAPLYRPSSAQSQRAPAPVGARALHVGRPSSASSGRWRLHILKLPRLAVSGGSPLSTDTGSASLMSPPHLRRCWRVHAWFSVHKVLTGPCGLRAWKRPCRGDGPVVPAHRGQPGACCQEGPCPRFPSQDIESRTLTLSALLPEIWSLGVRPVMAVQAASGECGGAPARIWAWGGAGALSSPEKSRCWSGGLSCLFAEPGRVWRGAGGDQQRPPLLGLGSSSLTSTSVWTWEAAPWAGVLAS